jgi:hypothetical protein
MARDDDVPPFPIARIALAQIGRNEFVLRGEAAVLLSGGLCIIAAPLVLRIGRGTEPDGLATATT